MSAWENYLEETLNTEGCHKDRPLWSPVGDWTFMRVDGLLTAHKMEWPGGWRDAVEGSMGLADEYIPLDAPLIEGMRTRADPDYAPLLALDEAREPEAPVPDASVPKEAEVRAGSFKTFFELGAREKEGVELTEAEVTSLIGLLDALFQERGRERGIAESVENVFSWGESDTLADPLKSGVFKLLCLLNRPVPSKLQAEAAENSR